MAKRKHLSARGKPINFDELQHQNKEVVAVGNANMNANGDILGRGGKVVRKVSDIPVNQLANPGTAYNQNNPKSTKLVSLKDKVDSLDTHQNPLLKDEEKPQQKVKKEEVVDESVVSVEEEKTKSKRKIVDSED